MSLDKSSLVAFVATVDPDRARAFYRDVLGLDLVDETPYALVFDAAGTMLRVTRVETLHPADHTVLGWTVDDVAATVQDLAARGVEMKRYPDMEQDANGVWRAPGGAQIAWFADPDGNTLSVTQLV